MRKVLIGILTLGLTFFAAGSAEATLWIDEIGYDGIQPWHAGAGAPDPYVGARDFIEIWNESHQPVDISGLFISDNVGASLNWATGTIPARGFWVIVDGAGTDGLGAGAFSNTHYSFEDNRASGGLLAIYRTDALIAISTACLDGYAQNLDSIIDLVIFSNRDGSVAAGMRTDANAVIVAGAWDLWGAGSDANNWTDLTDQQPSVDISTNPGFIHRSGWDAPYDTPQQWRITHPNAPHLGNTGHTVIPEPTTMILLGLGLGFLGFKGLKKKKA